MSLTADADYDLTLVKTTAATWSSAGTDADLSNFFPDTGYTPLVTLYSYSGTTTVNLDSSAITLDSVNETLDFSVSYDKAVSALGLVDPGTWTLWAVGSDGSLTYVASGNLRIVMYS